MAIDYVAGHFVQIRGQMQVVGGRWLAVMAAVIMNCGKSSLKL